MTIKYREIYVVITLVVLIFVGISVFLLASKENSRNSVRWPYTTEEVTSREDFHNQRYESEEDLENAICDYWEQVSIDSYYDLDLYDTCMITTTDDDKQVIQIIHDNLFDDSTKSIMREYMIEQDDDGYYTEFYRSRSMCHMGRGSQDWGRDGCH